MLLVGITGGIATGKSAVARMFFQLGGHLIDSDVLSRLVVEPGKPAWKEIIEYFGKGVLNKDQTLNRLTLGELVFCDDTKRKKLEQIIHPHIEQEQRSIIEDIVQEEPNALIFIDIPLLVELSWQEKVDRVVLVYASSQIQLKRVMLRDKFALEDAKKRLKSQIPIDQKLKHADYIIRNEGPLEETEKQVRKVYCELLEVERSKKK